MHWWVPTGIDPNFFLYCVSLVVGCFSPLGPCTTACLGKLRLDFLNLRLQFFFENLFLCVRIRCTCSPFFPFAVNDVGVWGGVPSPPHTDQWRGWRPPAVGLPPEALAPLAGWRRALALHTLALDLRGCCLAKGLFIYILFYFVQLPKLTPSGGPEPGELGGGWGPTPLWGKTSPLCLTGLCRPLWHSLGDATAPWRPLRWACRPRWPPPLCSGVGRKPCREPGAPTFL